MKNTALATALVLLSGTSIAAPVYTYGIMDWADPAIGYYRADYTISGFVDEAEDTWGVSSTTPFYGLLWTAHDGVLLGQGRYSIDTIEGGVLEFTVGTGQIAGHILMDWGSATNIDLVNIWNINADGSLSHNWLPEPAFVDGPFPGFHAGFRLTTPGLVSTVPVPAAFWLFSSGFLLLSGFVRRKLNLTGWKKTG